RPFCLTARQALEQVAPVIQRRFEERILMNPSKRKLLTKITAFNVFIARRKKTHSAYNFFQRKCMHRHTVCCRVVFDRFASCTQRWNPILHCSTERDLVSSPRSFDEYDTPEAAMRETRALLSRRVLQHHA